MTLGSLGAGILVTYAPDLRQLIYSILLLLSAIEALVLWHVPETAARKPRAPSSVLPHVGVPKQARAALAHVTPVTIASWALGGFYFSLMPSLVRVATGATSPIVGGLVVSALTLAGALTVLSLRAMSASRMLGIGIAALVSGVLVTLSGVHTQQMSLLLIGTIISGAGFGATVSGAMRTVMPLARPDERAGLLTAFCIEGYLSFGLPAMLTGFLAPIVGLVPAADVYGLAVVLMATASLSRSPPCATGDDSGSLRQSTEFWNWGSFTVNQDHSV